MGLACSQAVLLSLTSRKASCEYGMTMDSLQKQALTREASNLSQEYYGKLQSKQLSYYANGQYNKMKYEYLMGYGRGSEGYLPILTGSAALKEVNSMVLADYKGQVVLSDNYANVITSVLGSGFLSETGEGKTFSLDKIPEMISKVLNGTVKAEEVEKVLNNELISSSLTSETVNAITQQTEGYVEVDNSQEMTDLVKKLVDFYYPIFSAAATNGWTIEYNQEMKLNDDYISDAIVSGTLQLVDVNHNGDYDTGTTLNYFITAGYVQQNTSADYREEVTAWYNAAKARLSEKETYLDMHMADLSTELEAINAEIQSVKSLIDDAVSSVFDWGGG